MRNERNITVRKVIMRVVLGTRVLIVPKVL